MFYIIMYIVKMDFYTIATSTCSRVVDGLRASDGLCSAVRCDDNLSGLAVRGGVLLAVVGRESLVLLEAQNERADQEQTLGTRDASEEDGEWTLVLVDVIELILRQVVDESLIDLGASLAVAADARS